MQRKGTVPIESKPLLLRRFTDKDSQFAFYNRKSDGKVTEYLRVADTSDIALEESNGAKGYTSFELSN